MSHLTILFPAEEQGVTNIKLPKYINVETGGGLEKEVV